MFEVVNVALVRSAFAFHAIVAELRFLSFEAQVIALGTITRARIFAYSLIHG